MVVLSRMAGRQSRAPFSRNANISGRTSTSERIGQKPETISPRHEVDMFLGGLGHAERHLDAPERVERVAPGQRFLAQMSFQGLGGRSCAPLWSASAQKTQIGMRPRRRRESDGGTFSKEGK